MARAATTPFRTPLRLSRWVLAGILLLLALTSVAATFANAMVRSDAANALHLAPRDGLIAGAAALEIEASSGTAASRQRAAALARSAIRADPTAVDGLIVLAMQATLARDDARSDLLHIQVGRLTRRELRAQMWGIERAVNQGDIGGALHNYDLALRTSRAAPRVLFPTLAAALREPRVRQQLVDVLAEKPQWTPDFLAFLAGSTLDPRSARLLFNEAAAAGIEVSVAAQSQLVNQLIARRAFADAFALYSEIRPGAVRTASRDPRFTTQSDHRSALDWMGGEEPGMSVTIAPNQTGGEVDFAAAPQTGGMVLKQLQLLPPGRYRFSHRVSDVEARKTAMPYWVLMCETGLELGRAPIAVNDSAGSADFTVPDECEVQTLALMVRPNDSLSGVSGKVRRAALKPVGKL